MKQVFLVFLSVVCLALCVAPARACFCIIPEVSQSFRDARSVFLGQTIQIDEPKTHDENALIADRAYTVRFKITRSWKGVPASASEFTVLWLTNCYECLPLPKMNENYLVFATPLRGSRSLSLVAMCNRTVGVDSKATDPDSKPERDMKQLDVIAKPAFMFGSSPNRRTRIKVVARERQQHSNNDFHFEKPFVLGGLNLKPRGS